MAWRMFRVTYKLLNPLHIGYHKVGNAQRTRYYVPARNLWGGITQQLTRCRFQSAGVSQRDYAQIGEWVREHCAFAYFFLRDKDGTFYPQWTEKGLRYGPLPTPEFERQWLSALVTTALHTSSTPAETGSLHEVEYIAPYRMSYSGKVRLTKLCGWVLLDEVGLQELGDPTKWNRWLGELQVGGERRYGFGRLRLSRMVGRKRRVCSRATPFISTGSSLKSPLRSSEPFWRTSPQKEYRGKD